jgi:iron complex transport system substrate-binding protein
MMVPLLADHWERLSSMSARTGFRFMATMLTLVVTGCGTAGTTPSAQTPGAGAVTVKDCQGKDVVFPDTPKRAVTIDGWAAQAMARLELTDKIVGTGFTGPLKAEKEPYLGRLAKVPVIADKLPATESVAALGPDVVLTGFSAFGGAPGTPKEADLATMRAPGIAACFNAKAGPMTDLTPMYEYLTRIGQAFRVTDRADLVIRELKAREDAVRTKAPAARPRVLALADNPVAGQPVKALGGATPANAIIHLAGGDNVFDDVTSMHADVSPEKIAELDPQVIWVVTDFSFAKTTGQQLVGQISANPLLATTAAARDKRILTSSQYAVGFPSPLNVDGLEQLAAELRR